MAVEWSRVSGCKVSRSLGVLIDEECECVASCSEWDEDGGDVSEPTAIADTPNEGADTFMAN